MSQRYILRFSISPAPPDKLVEWSEPAFIERVPLDSTGMSLEDRAEYRHTSTLTPAEWREISNYHRELAEYHYGLSSYARKMSKL